MAFNAEVKNARGEIEAVHKDCLELVTRAEQAFHESQTQHHEILRLMIVPILYSAWERLFTLTNSIRIKLIQRSSRTCQRYTPIERVAWLSQERFFKSFRDRCAQASVDHQAVENFLFAIDEWHSKPLTDSLKPEVLPVTRSNVNPEVVRLNARLFGLENEPRFMRLDLSKLDELVGRRNDIGHGGTTKPPGPRELEELITYSKELLQDYADLLSISLTRLRRHKSRTRKVIRKGPTDR